MNKRALISVYDKNGILDLARFLVSSGWEILSTGGTAKSLKDNGIAVTDVSAITGFPECLDGRVKTLHPALHAGILARRDNREHMDTLERLKVGAIDLVCVNLYPFFEKVQAGLTEAETVEFIDIGGPSMLRAAAKNFSDVIVLSDPADYETVMSALKEGAVPPEMKKHLAAKVFELCSAYDAAVARYLLQGDAPAGREEFGAYLPFSLKKAQNLRYGENGHQTAALYLNTDKPGAVSGMEQLHGKESGYNNIRDMDLAWKAAAAFGVYPQGLDHEPVCLPLGGAEVLSLVPEALRPPATPEACCVAVKHNSPCGIALGASPLEAYEKTFACDPLSIFGGIVAFNVPVDRAAAEKLSELFLEIVIAPAFAEEALHILKKKKNLRIVRASIPPGDTREYAAVDGGLLVQETDRRLMEKWEPVTAARPEAQDARDMIFGMRAVIFVKSNAVLIVKDRAATGIGGGQVNRIWPTADALKRSKIVVGGKSARVLASDAFFPFADVVETAAQMGIKAIIQPGGSVNDRLSIEACDRYGIAMVFTGTRHFKH